MSRHSVALPPIQSNRTRFLATPRSITDHDIDPTAPKHPWDERYDWCDGLATCACCGARVKRVAIVTATGGTEFDLGLDCYARHYDAKPIRKRIRESEKARAGWAGALTMKSDAPEQARRILAASAGEKITQPAIDLSKPESAARWLRICDRWAEYIPQIEGDDRLTVCDRADLLVAFRTTIASWRALVP